MQLIFRSNELHDIQADQPQSTSDNENNERTCVIIQYWAGDEVPSAECNRES